MSWKSTIKKNRIDADILAQQIANNIMKQMVGIMDSEGYDKRVTSIIASHKFDFQREVKESIQKFQGRMDKAILNDGRFSDKMQERLQ